MSYEIGVGAGHHTQLSGGCWLSAVASKTRLLQWMCAYSPTPAAVIIERGLRFSRLNRPSF
eukprot:5117490-Pleurochrysis_carterae.AAC.1